MSQNALLKPNTYTEAGTDAHPDKPALQGGRCACGAVFFPMQTYGCEVCGAYGEALQTHALSGAGTLVSSATVYINMGPPKLAVPDVPFVVGEIALEDGPVIRAILSRVSEGDLKPGQPMATEFVEIGDDERGHYRDLRFTPVAI